MTKQAEDDLTPWLVVDAADGQQSRFASTGHAAQYLELEAEKWAWLQGVARPAPNFMLLHEFAGYVTGSDPERPKPGNEEAIEAWLKVRVQTYLTFNPAVHDRSLLQPYLLSIRDRNVQEAAWTLCWLLHLNGRAPQLTSQQQLLHGRDAYFAIAGMINAWLWAARQVHVGPPEAFERLVREAGVGVDAIASYQHTANRDADAMKALLKTSRDHHEDFAKRLEDDTMRRREELRALYDSSAAEMEDEWRALHRTYDEKLALAAPSKYWAGKQRVHKKLAVGFGAALGVVSIGGLLGLAYLASEVFGSTQVNVVPKWSQAITITAAVVLLVWTLKTLIRLTLSHTHLEIDANERRIMILSYLAMLKKSDSTDEQRTALFTAIFRPTGNGLIADEAVPVPLLDLLKAK